MKQLSEWIQKLKSRQTLSLSLIVLGIILILITNHLMNKVENAKNSINHVTGFFTNSSGIWNPLIKFFGGKANEEASKYDAILSLLLVLGIAFAIAGVFLFFRRKRK